MPTRPSLLVWSPFPLYLQAMLTTRNVFIANLAVSDILLCSFTLPLTLVDLLNNYWTLGEHMVSQGTAHCTPQAVHCTLHTAHYTVHTAHRTLHTIHCTLHTVRCTMHTLHFTLQTLYCTLYTAHFTLHTLHCPLHTAQQLINLSVHQAIGCPN